MLAAGLMILTTCLWTLWGVSEMYYEGWWGPWSLRLRYLAPGLICLALTLLACTWPRLGGWVILSLGGAFTVWWWVRGGFSLRRVLATFPVSGLLVFIGLLFLLEARRLRSGGARGRLWDHPTPLLALAAPLVVAAAVSAYWLPRLASRLDDGGRGARRITGNGVDLIWAPAGPGWSMTVEGGPPLGGRIPGWAELALYGLPPVGFSDKAGLASGKPDAGSLRAYGLCRFLSADGRRLMQERQDLWRMPTVDELVRSLVHHGQNAGCTWDGVSSRAQCALPPDKETPLWAPDWSPIYYWAADEYGAGEAYYVGYSGRVGHQPKSWGNPRHGYRCVREP